MRFLYLIRFPSTGRSLPNPAKSFSHSTPRQHSSGCRCSWSRTWQLRRLPGTIYSIIFLHGNTVSTSVPSWKSPATSVSGFDRWRRRWRLLFDLRSSYESPSRNLLDPVDSRQWISLALKMKKRTLSLKSLSKEKSLLSPLPSPSPEARSSKAYKFNFFISATSSKKKGLSPPSVLRSLCTPAKLLPTTADLRDMAFSNLECLKRRVDVCYTDILKEIDASHSRTSKRFKIQTQACMQLIEVAEREYKNISDKIDEISKALKGSYVEFMAEVQAATSRVCKASIQELSQSAEKDIESLQRRNGIAPNPA